MTGQKQLTFDCTHLVKFGKIHGVHPNSFTTIERCSGGHPGSQNYVKDFPKNILKHSIKIVDLVKVVFFFVGRWISMGEFGQSILSLMVKKVGGRNPASQLSH